MKKKDPTPVPSPAARKPEDPVVPELEEKIEQVDDGNLNPKTLNSLTSKHEPCKQKREWKPRVREWIQSKLGMQRKRKSIQIVFNRLFVRNLS